MDRITKHIFGLCPLLLDISLTSSSEIHEASSSAPSQAHIAHIPPEIWDLILRQLGDDSLFNAGGVCRSFNIRCTAIYSERKNIDPQSLAGGSLDTQSDSLPALLLPTLTPQLRTLVCRFSSAENVIQDLEHLRAFLARSQSMEDLQLHFPAEQLPSTQEELDAKLEAQEALLPQMDALLHEMADKTAGPAFIMPTSHVYMIGQWRSRFGRGGSPGWFGLTPNEEQPYMCNLVWGPVFSRKFAPGGSAANPSSVHLKRVLGSSEAPGPFTFIAFDVDGKWWFAIDQDYANGFPAWEPSARPQDMRVVLPHIMLPSLRFLYINERTDPIPLTQFLLRHQTIELISDQVKGEGFELLAGASLALPLLTNLACADVAHLGPLLDAFDDSPRLRTFQISVKQHTPAAVASLMHALRRLSLSVLSEPAHLEIDLRGTDLLDMDPGETDELPSREALWEPIDDAERLIVGCLYGVDSVRVKCRTVSTARTFIPWLAMLPALQSLDLDIRREGTDSGGSFPAASIALLAETRAAMPWVPDIELGSDQ
ncbi:hypothetical protein FB451DRAFT_1553118 [Mycena latifolia]|nr:hypothetical protein FB451DRAFT_1553118 [Mycena latifolia]